MPVSVRYNAHDIMVPPRLAQIILFLISHQEVISQMPKCTLTFHCGHGEDVQGEMLMRLPKPQLLS